MLGSEDCACVFCMRVHVCIHVSGYGCMYVEARVPQVFLSFICLFVLGEGDRVSPWSGFHHVGSSGWPVNSRDLSISTFPVLGLYIHLMLWVQGAEMKSSRP